MRKDKDREKKGKRRESWLVRGRGEKKQGRERSKSKVRRRGRELIVLGALRELRAGKRGAYC